MTDTPEEEITPSDGPTEPEQDDDLLAVADAEEDDDPLTQAGEEADAP